MLLTNQERMLFADYCHQYAESCDAIASQFSKWGMPAAFADEMAKRERAKAAAFKIVEQHLMETAWYWGEQ